MFILSNHMTKSFISKVIENIKKSVDDTIGVASWKSHARLMKMGEGKQHKNTYTNTKYVNYLGMLF